MFKIAFILILFININLFCDSEYRWPLDIKNGFSSTFGEFRYTHIHGGLDLRTFQKNGYPVYAISDGKIYLIRSVFRGSGNGIYMKHDDGRVSVYYHLDRFGEILESRVKKARVKKKYFGNHTLKVPVRVKKGDIIGYTGETGAGYPHLHIEIQDGNGRKLNPLNYLKSPMRDRYKPVISSVRLKSRNSTLINGKVGETQSFFRKRGKVHKASPVFVTGPFDISAALYDVTDTKRRATPYKISAAYDDSQFYSIVFDSFIWKDHNELGFIYDFLHSTPGYGVYNMSPFKNFTLAEVLDTARYYKEDGLGHEISIKAEDKDGNIKKGTVPVYHMKKPVVETVEMKNGILFFSNLEAPGCDTVQIKSLGTKKSRSFAVSYKNLVNWMSIKIPKGADAVELLFRKKGFVYYRYPLLLNGEMKEPFQDADVRTFINRKSVTVLFRNKKAPANGYHLEYTENGKANIVEPVSTVYGPAFVFEPEDINGDFKFSIVHKGNPELNSTHFIELVTLKPEKRRVFSRGEFRVTFGHTTVREPFILKYEEQEHSSEYPVLSKQHFIGPASVPFLDKVYVRIKKKDVKDRKQVGIFQYNYRYGKWFHAGSAYNKKRGEFYSKRRNGGLYALMRDIFPPKVGVYVETRRLHRMKAYYIKATDKGKGVNYRSLKVWVNGKQIDCEYDPDRKYAKVTDLKTLKVGKNSFRLEVKDWAGHKTERTITLKLRK